MSVSATSNSTSSASALAAAAATAATGGTSGTTTDTATNPNSTLTQNDFLQLLVAQIQYQDPMNPQSDTQMAAQMAQFTSLQQATQSTSSLAMIQANSLVGDNVSLQLSSNQTTNGVVTGVVMNDGSPQIMVGGTGYDLSQVSSITPATTANASNAAATTPAATTPASAGTSGAVTPTNSSSNN